MQEIDFRQHLMIFVNRWFLNSFAIWAIVMLLGKVSGDYDAGTFFLAGFIFSIINAVLKPILTILSLPAILLSLGLFTLVVNGFVVWFSLLLAPNISMSFWNAIVAGAILSLLNYTITSLANEKVEGRNL